MGLLPDSILAVRAATDPAAFAELFDEFYPRVYTYLRYRCSDDATADDLAAQTFERLLTHLGQFQPEKGPFAAWLFAIARNTTNDHFRRSRRLRWLPLERVENTYPTNSTPETDLLTTETHHELLVELSRLPERERDILALKFAGGLTNREIARLLGLGESHVGVLIFRAIGKLRSALEDTHE